VYIVVCMVHMLFIFVYVGQKPTMACVVLLFKMPTINKTYLILSYLRHLALYHYKKKHSILSIIHGHIFTTDFMGSFKPQALEFQIPFFLIWSPPWLWYGSLSRSISLSHLSIFYNIFCYNSLVLLTFVSRSSCRFTEKSGTRIPDPPFFLIWSLPRLWYES
jgi:hypothetical protein